MLLEKKGAAGSDKNAKPAGIVALIISVISRSFTPAITGTGMIKALLHIKRSVFMDGSLSWNIRIMAGVREDDCEWEHGFHPL
ncbi:hypothetical protein LTS97_23880, partial [Escherichia coli]